ncbi:thiamine phosphate synthase [Marinifilum breve]|uniref:Thiamine phosphate synthase n=1 Tax=Marinifilum breve TaxID=2184082 RepID=A0A2V4A4G8_9BACT|nr:thiamine phosphate synthase [Marinifilum breve]PXY02787.1 thiamine phosphate synthase [Marinifilum breve]
MQKRIPKIQYITQDHPQLSHSDQARLAFEQGIEAVQIRMKDSCSNDILKEATLALQYARQFDRILIINDSIEFAKEIGAHAVHLGLNDTSIDEARQILGDDIIIGGTANTFEDILLQKSRGADYVGLGPYRHTTTKKNLSPIVGIGGYREIIRQMNEKKIHTPIIAVGGILLDEIEMLQQTGLYGVAISGALLKTLNNQTHE